MCIHINVWIWYILPWKARSIREWLLSGRDGVGLEILGINLLWEVE